MAEVSKKPYRYYKKRMRCPYCKSLNTAHAGKIWNLKRYYCKDCGAHFSSKTKYQLQEKPEYKECPYCKGPMVKAGKASDKNQTQRYKCKSCGKKIVLTGFKKYENTKFVCPKCNSKNIRKGGFWKEEQVYQCKDCKHKFIPIDLTLDERTEIIKLYKYMNVDIESISKQLNISTYQIKRLIKSITR